MKRVMKILFMTVGGHFASNPLGNIGSDIL